MVSLLCSSNLCLDLPERDLLCILAFSLAFDGDADCLGATGWADLAAIPAAFVDIGRIVQQFSCGKQQRFEGGISERQGEGAMASSETGMLVE